jgi:hypothetical protein
MFGGRRVDHALEGQGSSIAHQIGLEMRDEGADDATAHQHASFSRHDVDVDMRAWVQPCRPLRKHTSIGDVQHLQLAPRTQANAHKRLLLIGDSA